jgi:thioesterase domain-containing protein
MAFEMAQQLVAAREEVAMLALLETWPPSVHRVNLLPMYLPPFFGIPVALARGLSRFGRALPSIRPDQWLKHLRKKLRSTREILSSKNANSGEMAELYTDVVSRSNYWAMFKYFPKVFPGRLVLILASERSVSSSRDPRLSWRRLAQKECHVHHSGGSDSGIMLTPPFVQQLAHVLELELALARGATGSGQSGDGDANPGAACAAGSAGVPQEAESAWS